VIKPLPIEYILIYIEADIKVINLSVSVAMSLKERGNYKKNENLKEIRFRNFGKTENSSFQWRATLTCLEEKMDTMEDYLTLK
jgi:hypothetical protein